MTGMTQSPAMFYPHGCQTLVLERNFHDIFLREWKLKTKQTKKTQQFKGKKSGLGKEVV